MDFRIFRKIPKAWETWKRWWNYHSNPPTPVMEMLFCYLKACISAELCFRPDKRIQKSSLRCKCIIIITLDLKGFPFKITICLKSTFWHHNPCRKEAAKSLHFSYQTEQHRCSAYTDVGCSWITWLNVKHDQAFIEKELESEIAVICIHECWPHICRYLILPHQWPEDILHMSNLR